MNLVRGCDKLLTRKRRRGVGGRDGRDFGEGKMVMCVCLCHVYVPIMFMYVDTRSSAIL